jgi:hypothetical protein
MAVQISLGFLLIFSPFTLASLAQRHFILSDSSEPIHIHNSLAAIQFWTPPRAILKPWIWSCRHLSIHHSSILAHSNSATEFECAPWGLHKPVHLNIVQTQQANDLRHSNHGCARLCTKLYKDIQSQNEGANSAKPIGWTEPWDATTPNKSLDVMGLCKAVPAKEGDWPSILNFFAQTHCNSYEGVFQ